MRRADREITERGELIRVLERCDVCRVALADGEFPYILPLNFGMESTEADSLALFFHGAADGRKYGLIENNGGKASFEADCQHVLFFDEEKEMCSMAYESVIGRGIITEVTEDAEKLRALGLILAH